MKLKTIIILTVAIIILLLVIVGAVSLYKIFAPKGIYVSLDQAAVVTQIQSLNRLETASFTIEKIIEAGTEGNAFEKILFGDKILLIAHGNIIAGFDLAKLKSSDVKVKDMSLDITLPAPEILVSSLDEKQTRVYDRRLGFFTKGDPTLESTARQAAETSLRQSACEGGILSVASDDARKQFEVMFMSAGFSQVLVQIPSATCK